MYLFDPSRTPVREGADRGGVRGRAETGGGRKSKGRAVVGIWAREGRERGMGWCGRGRWEARKGGWGGGEGGEGWKQKKGRTFPFSLRGDSCRIQTCNLLIRSQMLYSVELRSHLLFSGFSFPESECKSTNFFDTDQIFFHFLCMDWIFLLCIKRLYYENFSKNISHLSVFPYTSRYKRSRISQNSSSSSSYFDMMIISTSWPPLR